MSTDSHSVASPARECVAPSTRSSLGYGWRYPAAVLGVVYAVGMVVLLGFGPLTRETAWCAEWGALPLQVLALVLSLHTAVGHFRPARQTAIVWLLVAAFTLSDLIAALLWVEAPPSTGLYRLSAPDFGYLTGYVFLGAAYAATFKRFYGSFRSLRTWIDAAAIEAALLGALWTTLLSPSVGTRPAPIFDRDYLVAYSLIVTLSMTAAALVLTRLPAITRRPVPYVLVFGGLFALAWEIAWFANAMMGQNLFGLLRNLGDIVCFCAITVAAALARFRPGPVPEPIPAERTVYSFLPTTAALLAVALLSASLSGVRAVDSGMLLGLVTLIALLLITRQVSVRRDLAHVHALLADQMASSRLSEFVRLSADAFLLCDPAGRITYGSPAVERVCQKSVDSVLGTPITGLFGAELKGRVQALLDDLHDLPLRPRSIEVVCLGQGKDERRLRIAGSNQVANPFVRGLMFSVSDVSEQRALERDVIHVANDERTRIAAHIHDQLGQELTGIAFLVQGAVGTVQRDPSKASSLLSDIAGHLRTAIRHTSELARGLAPLYVVRGSLRSALEHLEDVDHGAPLVLVEVDAALDDTAVDPHVADHLLRIAQEAVLNARRHARCQQILVALTADGASLRLVVSDDGVGMSQTVDAGSGFGLRMMRYRAELLGAQHQVIASIPNGTQVVTTFATRPS